MSMKNRIGEMIATGDNGVELKFILIIVSGMIVIRLLQVLPPKQHLPYFIDAELIVIIS
jgi:hypothetical protein